MNFKRFLHKTGTSALRHLMLLPLMAAVLTSCNGMMYDEEGDCNPYHKVKFVFDKNLSFADAFDKEVNQVTLYLVDAQTGNVVWSKTESGDDVRSAGYLMDVDAAPGTYRMIAWCGEGTGVHFDVAEAAHFTELNCTLRRGHNEFGAFTGEKLNRLYHGHVESETFTDEEGVHVHTVELVKNTNNVNVILQNVSGKAINKDNFTFRIAEDNGKMNWDNSLMEDEEIKYHPYAVEPGSAGIETPEYEGDETHASRTITQVNTCVAQFTVGRMMADRDMIVTITNSKGRDVLKLPLIDYAILAKGHYGHLENQDYLDRQDKYDLVFFLDDRDEWIKTYIVINSWHVVVQDADL